VASAAAIAAGNLRICHSLATLPGSAALDVPGVIDDNAASQAARYMWDTQERRAASEPRLLSCMQSHFLSRVINTK